MAIGSCFIGTDPWKSSSLEWRREDDDPSAMALLHEGTGTGSGREKGTSLNCTRQSRNLVFQQAFIRAGTARTGWARLRSNLD